MLTPTVANRFSFFYAAGNTPATSLTRYVPNDVDADILSLGTGDLRQILYTAYTEKDNSTRKLDITSCDIDDKVIGRNVFLLTFLIDDDPDTTDDFLFTSYYDVLIDEKTTLLIKKQADKLLPLLNSAKSWKSSKYGRALKFCDAATLEDTHKICSKIADGANLQSTEARQAMQKNLAIARKFQHDQSAGGSVLTGMRSASPLAVLSGEEMPRSYSRYWSTGRTSLTAKGDLPNPTIAAVITDDSTLHYGTDPVMGFHLGAAYAPLLDHSPLKPGSENGEFKATMAAKSQFREWVKALKRMLKANMTLRFVVSDVFALCHTLQHFAATGNGNANWFRRQWDARLMKLDADIYADKKNAVAFDVIDSSNLADHFGTLNLLIATVPLLKDQPWATVGTELLIKTAESQQKAFDGNMCGNAATISLLLGVSPIQYWTNAKAESHVDEVLLGLLHGASDTKATQLHSRLAWKRGWLMSNETEGRQKLHLPPEGLARIIFEAYSYMFENENLSAGLSALTMAKATYSHFHRGTFVTFLKFLKQRMATDWDAVIIQCLDMIDKDTSISLSGQHSQDLGAQLYLHGVFTSPWLVAAQKPAPATSIFSGWSTIPPVVAVTLIVPRGALMRLFGGADKKSQLAAPTLLGSLKSAPTASNQWHNMFGEVQIVFGKVKRSKTAKPEDSRLEIEQDYDGFLGSSPLIATFYLPSAAIQVDPTHALIGLGVAATGQSAAMFYSTLGPSLTLFETKLSDTENVLISKFVPSQSGYVSCCGKFEQLENTTADRKLEVRKKLSADVPANFSQIKSLTGRVDVDAAKGRDLLKKGTPLELKQVSPFEVEIVFGNNLLKYPVKFPIPITKDGSRTRIARTSGYIEVIVLIANPKDTSCLKDYIFPSTLSNASLPVALNIPYVNLGRLPVLDLQQQSRMKWLITHASLQFSNREKDLRGNRDAEGLVDDPRVNFKETIFSMFMLCSGLQGGQTGLFAINHPSEGGIHMLIFVSAMLLDGDTGSVVLDAAVIPFTRQLIDSGKMNSFLLILRELECCSMNVNDPELETWKKALPALVERCRTWTHKSNCEYKKKSATVPLGLGHGQPVLCSCGKGKLPARFTDLPEWDTAAVEATRIAISLTYAVPFVEDVFDPQMFDQGATAGFLSGDRCRICGDEESKDGGDLLVCTRCRGARYCSRECQKKDWKVHRMECEAKDN